MKNPGRVWIINAISHNHQNWNCTVILMPDFNADYFGTILFHSNDCCWWVMAERELSVQCSFPRMPLMILHLNISPVHYWYDSSLHNEGCLRTSTFPRPFHPSPQYLSPRCLISWQATSFADRLFNVKITLYILISFLGQFGTTFPELFLNNISKQSNSSQDSSQS